VLFSEFWVPPESSKSVFKLLSFQSLSPKKIWKKNENEKNEEITLHHRQNLTAKQKKSNWLTLFFFEIIHRVFSKKKHKQKLRKKSTTNAFLVRKESYATKVSKLKISPQGTKTLGDSVPHSPQGTDFLKIRFSGNDFLTILSDTKCSLYTKYHGKMLF